MAYLTIISGTHQFNDSFNIFRTAYIKNTVYKYDIDGIKFKKRRFDRVVIMKDGNIVTLPPIIAHLGYGNFSVTQTMGSGKTILGMEHLARTHFSGFATAANMSVQWFPSNRNKPKKEWIPNVNSLDDLDKARKVTVLFDDIKKTITKWQAKEADMISGIVNASRKESVNMLLTTQRVINFVPKDIREVATNYEVPYITIRDMRQKSPDSMGKPLEMEVFNISANDVFLGFGLHNGFMPDNSTLILNDKLLNSYSTLEIAVDLKNGGSAVPLDKNINREPYTGYYNEMKVFKELSKYQGELTHLSFENPHEHDSDILFVNGKKYLIDSVACRLHGNYYSLSTDHKDMNKLYEDAKTRKIIRMLAFEYKKKIRLIDVKHLAGKGGEIRVSEHVRTHYRTPYQLFKLKAN